MWYDGLCFIYVAVLILIRQALLDVRQYWGSYFRYITTESDELTQKRCNSSALFFLIAELKSFYIEKKTQTFCHQKRKHLVASWIKSIVSHYFPASYFDRLLTLESDYSVYLQWGECHYINTHCSANAKCRRIGCNEIYQWNIVKV